MNLFKRGKVWWVYVQVDGVRQAKTTGTGNRRQAEAIGSVFEEMLNLKRHNLPQFQPDMTFNELFARFTAEGLSTLYSRERLVHLLPFFGELPLSKIDKSSVRRYRQQRHAASEITVATANRDVAVLRHLLYFAVEEGIITTNPLARMRMERERRTKKPILSYREESLLLPVAIAHLRRIIIAAVDTGMRRGEILWQRWEDIDFENRFLCVSRSKTPEGEMREIPLTTRLHDLLLPLWKESGFVFTLEDEPPEEGMPENEQKPLKTVKSSWASALRRAKLRHFRFHDLRHTANTRLMLAGVMQEVRRELIGHTSRHSRDVNDRYTQIGLPEKRDAIRKLEIWLDAEAERLAQPTDAPAQPQ
jgi:integrase